LEKLTDGRQERLVNTDDFLTIAEEESKMDLDWFFELYLRQPKLAKLVSDVSGSTMNLRWETPNDMRFPMPIDVLLTEDAAGRDEERSRFDQFHGRRSDDRSEWVGLKAQ
jgi:aminopeptidase N